MAISTTATLSLVITISSIFLGSVTPNKLTYRGLPYSKPAVTGANQAAHICWYRGNTYQASTLSFIPNLIGKRNYRGLVY